MKLTKQQLRVVVAAAESVAARYEAISKIDFLVEVKNIVGSGNNDIKTALNVWKANYAD